MKYSNPSHKAFCNLQATCLSPQNSTEILELLMLNGADIDALDGEGNSVLDVAFETGKVELIAFIVGKIEGSV